MTTFTFSNRDTWLAYRAEWKARYKNQSEAIRALKRQMSSMKGQDTSSEQYQLFRLRREANQMMVELNEAKEFKAQQMAAIAALVA